MKRNSLFWALGWVTMGSLAALQGCGGDDDDEGTGGGGGTSGSKATGGSAGSATGGKGGSSTGGKGGSSTGGSSTGGKGGSATGGAGGAPGGAGGEGGGGSQTREQACTDYCQVFQDSMCRTFSTNTYDDEADCRDVCNASNWEIGDEGDTSGNSINCRITHAGLAAANPGMREVHCGHASENSTGNCVD